ncbi:hypothetical protein HCH_06833 [Hahella chejuensis KCTC 2396]|uniref:Uncharacterized protein n=1 Tax=Hahella chejuensis (strain KCTC 2396) TaxID=349521 RepID=Q2S7C0_HAHCH|nr:hypothetical protein [Hahella chejuensis]ABC33454.1 hypothetical protein HCH_06833 [Hahella chejuensis KCTC 2396]
MTDAPLSRHGLILKRLLFLVFIYAGLAYGLSLLEYTVFNLTGWSPVSIERSVELRSREEVKKEFDLCGGPLFAANAVVSAREGDPLLARCGRFWPFYHYTIEATAHPLLPGSFILYPDEAPEAATARENFIINMQVVNGGFALVALFVIGLSCFAGYRFLIRKDEEAGYRTAFHGFISSFLMLACYSGVMFLIDPTFSFGW